MVVSVFLKWDVATHKKKMIPRVKGWQDLSLVNARKMVDDTANAVAIVTGASSGLLVIDVDLPGLDPWNAVVAKYGLPAVPRVRTGSGGLHYYFDWNLSIKAGLTNLRNQVTLVLPGV